MNRRNQINIEKQLNEFYSILDYKPLSANAISLYLILLQIDCKTDWLVEFKVANSVLMSKVKNLTMSSLQRARNELINNHFILYKKGKNQNDVSTYSIINFYFEQANEQAHEQASEQADEHIITKLNLLFNYIYKKESGEKIGLTEADREHLILIFKSLEMFTEDVKAYDYMTKDRLLDEKILMWCIKEIYLSPYKIFLKKLNRENIVFKYLKTKKYISEKANYRLEEIINYFIVCLKEELERGK